MNIEKNLIGEQCETSENIPFFNMILFTAAINGCLRGALSRRPRGARSRSSREAGSNRSRGSRSRNSRGNRRKHSIPSPYHIGHAFFLREGMGQGERICETVSLKLWNWIERDVLEKGGNCFTKDKVQGRSSLLIVGRVVGFYWIPSKIDDRYLGKSMLMSWSKH